MKRVDKPWGFELWWTVTDRYVGKLIHVNANEALSLQYHNQKHESMYCIKGQGQITLNDEAVKLEPGVAVVIPPLTRHRLVATTDLEVIEVSTPELDDVVRLEDRYGRAGTSAP